MKRKKWNNTAKLKMKRFEYMEENQMLEKDLEEVFKGIKNEILNVQYDIFEEFFRKKFS